MAFALLYNHQDFSDMVGQAMATVNTLPGPDRNLLNAIYNGGLSNWANAPVAPDPYNDGTVDNPTLAIVITATSQGRAVTKADMAGLLDRIADANVDAGFLHSIASDIRVTAVEPWPPA